MRATETAADVVLVGTGIMSATLATMLRELDPSLVVHVLERLPTLASESSDAWNNAGTGHAALCELNYTPETPEHAIDVTKAMTIDEQFEQSKQLWSYLVEAGRLAHPKTFIRSVPHASFVRGEADVDYLRRRHAALTRSHLFEGMRFSTDPRELAGFAPLVMEGRDPNEAVAMTRSGLGTDVDFGVLSRAMIGDLVRTAAIHLHMQHEVADIERGADRRWRIEARNLRDDESIVFRAGFVFIGAGGAALTLLAKSDIPEAEGFGGFPISGQWLRCTNPDVIARHHAKVYGKARSGAPPMSVPHLDTRIIAGAPALLFGPFAGFSTKFLKHGSYLDFAGSLETANVIPMLAAGVDNLELTKYLVEQVSLTHEERIDALREFVPTARATDWELALAGQRVQVIKKDPLRGGVLEFGTEVVSARDGSLAALLGASPGASTAVSIMLDLVHRCMPERASSEAFRAKLAAMVPSYGRSLAEDAALTRAVRARCDRWLELEPDA